MDTLNTNRLAAPAEQDEKPREELTAEDLDQVTGGASNGTHIPKVVIE
jgi:bacteriocin-like protein